MLLERRIPQAARSPALSRQECLRHHDCLSAAISLADVEGSAVNVDFMAIFVPTYLIGTLSSLCISNVHCDLRCNFRLNGFQFLCWLLTQRPFADWAMSLFRNEDHAAIHAALTDKVAFFTSLAATNIVLFSASVANSPGHRFSFCLVDPCSLYFDPGFICLLQNCQTMCIGSAAIPRQWSRGFGFL